MPFCLLAGFLTTSNVALATQTSPAPTPAAERAAAPTPALTPAKKRAGYSLPWGLRPAVAPNIVRVDSALASQRTATTLATTVLGGYKPWSGLPDLGLYARVAIVYQDPDGKPGSAAVSNPILFALYTPEIVPKLRLSLFAGVTAPIGQGGGDAPDAGARAAVVAGIYARSALDNALFAVNYMTPTAGVGVAYIAHGLTLQGEVTLLQLLRVRGEAVDLDAARTNFTTGLHAGYALAGGLVTASVELRYQRWLSTPASVTKDPSTREQATAGAGFRSNLLLSKTILARPGIAYFVPLDDPMAKAGYRILQLDVPVTF